MRRSWAKFTLMSLLALLGMAASAASKDSSNAIARLLNSRAAGSPNAYVEAARTVAKDAEAGRPLQQYVIALVAEDAGFPAELRLSPETRQRYLSQSRQKIRTLAESKGNALAWYLLSLEENNLTYLKRAAEGGNVQALNAWGTITLTQALQNPGVDTNDVDKIIVKSFGYFKDAAAQGDANGQYNLGMCYLHGYGCVRDQDLAFNSFRASALAGHPEAINNIGGFYRDGIVVEKNLEQAARWFKKSADLGNAYGQLNYALALQRGEGVPRDIAAAVAIFKAAAEQGQAEAMNAYGMCFFTGDGVEKTPGEAVNWFRRSAQLGFPPAMDNLASCYKLGVGVREDETEATVWKVRAMAARGDRNAAAWLSQNGHTLR